MKKDLSKYKALVFDIDGTLYDYDRCNEFAYKKVIDYCHLRHNVSNEECLNLLNESRNEVKRWVDKRTAAHHNRILYFQEFIKRLSGKANPSEVVKIYDLYNDTFYSQMTLFEELKPFLFSGKRIGVCTNMITEVQLKKIIRLGLDEVVDCVVTSEDCGCEKPDEKIYKKVIDELEVEFKDCLFIGDDELLDVVAPRKLGAESLNVNEILGEVKV